MIKIKISKTGDSQGFFKFSVTGDFYEKRNFPTVREGRYFEMDGEEYFRIGDFWEHKTHGKKTVEINI